jgi:hypothetical protein
LSIFLALAAKEFVMSFYQQHIVPHLVNLAMRNRELEPYRQRVLAGAEGRVLELELALARTWNSTRHA